MDGTIIAGKALPNHPVQLHLITGIAHNGMGNGSHNGQVFKTGVGTAIKTGADAGIRTKYIDGIVLVSEGDVQLIQRTAGHKSRHGVYHRDIAAQRESGRHAHHIRLTNTAVYKAVGMGFLKAQEKRSATQICIQYHNAVVFFQHFRYGCNQLVAELAAKSPIFLQHCLFLLRYFSQFKNCGINYSPAFLKYLRCMVIRHFLIVLDTLALDGIQNNANRLVFYCLRLIDAIIDGFLTGTINTMQLFSLLWAINWNASQFCPSFSSPSPMHT